MAAGWIETHSGRKFHFENFGPENFWLPDIAVALARQCRYNGHTRRHYSVAEHCCHMADHVVASGGSARDALTALHHDDPEYVMGDMVRPLKQDFPGFSALEESMHCAVAQRFGTHYPHPDWLKSLDSRILVDERRGVMNRSLNVWGTDELQPLGDVRFWSVLGRWAAYARSQWMRRHADLSMRMSFEDRGERYVEAP